MNTNSGYKEDDIVMLKTKSKPIKCKVLKKVGYTKLLLEDIDFTPPDPVAVGGKGWSKHTNTQLGHTYEAHVDDIIIVPQEASEEE